MENFRISLKECTILKVLINVAIIDMIGADDDLAWNLNNRLSWIIQVLCCIEATDAGNRISPTFTVEDAAVGKYPVIEPLQGWVVDRHTFLA